MRIQVSQSWSCWPSSEYLTANARIPIEIPLFCSLGSKQNAEKNTCTFAPFGYCSPRSFIACEKIDIQQLGYLLISSVRGWRRACEVGRVATYAYEEVTHSRDSHSLGWDNTLSISERTLSTSSLTWTLIHSSTPFSIQLVLSSSSAGALIVIGGLQVYSSMSSESLLITETTFRLLLASPRLFHLHRVLQNHQWQTNRSETRTYKVIHSCKSSAIETQPIFRSKAVRRPHAHSRLGLGSCWKAVDGHAIMAKYPTLYGPVWFVWDRCCGVWQQLYSTKPRVIPTFDEHQGAQCP